MKVYISADLEGVLGVTSPHQCFPASHDTAGYHQAVNQLTVELKTVIDALAQHGVTDVTVNDSHGYMTNLTPLHLGEHVRLLTGKPKACAMSAGLDASFDVAFYLGYHSMAGTQNGVLCHTFHDQVFDLTLNGKPYGETGVNALYAQLLHGVPVGLISGDAAVCAEARQLIPGIQTVETKQGLSFSAALHQPWLALRQQYTQAVANALAAVTTGCVARLTDLPTAPFTLGLTLSTTQGADIAATLPWVTRQSGRTVCLTTGNFTDLYRGLQSLYAILAYPATPAASHLD
jgi:D-amino peptidase